MLVISNWPCALCLSDFEITCTITPTNVLHLVQLLIVIIKVIFLPILINICTLCLLASHCNISFCSGQLKIAEGNTSSHN